MVRLYLAGPADPKAPPEMVLTLQDGAPTEQLFSVGESTLLEKVSNMRFV